VPTKIKNQQTLTSELV